MSIALLDYFAIILQPCDYCGGRHVDLALNGVDRVDSKGSYSIENSVPCCKTCNFMKGPMAKGEFFDQVFAIQKHAGQQERWYRAKAAPTTPVAWAQTTAA